MSDMRIYGIMVTEREHRSVLVKKVDTTYMVEYGNG